MTPISDILALHRVHEDLGGVAGLESVHLVNRLLKPYECHGGGASLDHPAARRISDMTLHTVKPLHR